MCLYVDDKRVGCTPSDFKLESPSLIDFMKFASEASDVTGSVFKLIWTSTYVQISGLKVRFHQNKKAEFSAPDVSPDIVYRLTDYNRLVWTDEGTGGSNSISVWTSDNYMPGFCSLGDIATKYYARPSIKHVYVKAGFEIVGSHCLN